MCKIISTISCKGGVGKTTSTVNIGAYIQMRGKKVCVVDLDAQHNATRHLGIQQEQLRQSPTIYDILLAKINDCEDAELQSLIAQSIQKSTTVDVIPATPKLASLETLMASAIRREYILDSILKFLKGQYDFIFLDCRPGLDLVSLNALTAADSVLIPVEAHILSSDGLDQVVRIIRSTKKNLNPHLSIEGIIITKFQGRTTCCNSVKELVDQEFGDTIHIFSEPVRYAIAAAEAPAYGVSIHEYNPKNDVAQTYAKIAEEVMTHA